MNEPIEPEAFPRQVACHDQRSLGWYSEPGMSLRTYIATKALNGILADALIAELQKTT